MVVERGAQVRHAVGLNLAAGGLLVAAEAFEDLRDRGETFEHVKCRDAARRTRGHAALRIDTQHQGRTMVAFGDPAGDNADHAGMPTLAGNDDE